MDAITKKQAEDIFNRFCAHMKTNGWHFETDTQDNSFVIIANARGEDLPMQLIIRIDAQRELITLHSPIPFSMSKEKLIEGAVVTSMINNVLADGSFDYDVQAGSILFRLTTSWKGGLIADEVFEYMLMLSGYTIDKYNDKLLMVSKGMMSVADFYNFIHKD